MISGKDFLGSVWQLWLIFKNCAKKYTEFCRDYGKVVKTHTTQKLGATNDSVK